MNEAKALSEIQRFYVLGVETGNAAAIAERKNGTHSFRKEVNARRFAHRLSASEPGVRFYVLASVAGFLATTNVAKKVYNG